MPEIRANARERLKNRCRVCPVCNGRVCAGEVPGMGGAGSGLAFMENVRSLQSWKLNMRTLHDISEPELDLELWGASLALPVMIAPMAGASSNLDNAMQEKELADALHAGAKNAGSLCWSGDGANPDFFVAGLAAMSEHGGLGIPTIKPRGAEEIIKRIRLAEDAGALAVAVDVDTAGFQSMTALGQPVGPTKPADIAALVKATSLPVLLKGVMTADEALLAASLGVRGVVVSNHGGRVFEYCPGTAEVLEEVASAVKGKITVFMDGGVRSGADVLKALALGADAVLVGRPFIVAAAGAGSEGVRLALRQFADELSQAMILTGTASVRRVSPAILAKSACACRP